MSDDLRTQLSEMEDLDENIIAGKPWAENMLKRALETTKKSVLHWCNFINKIGETEVNIEEDVQIFEKQVERLYEELILDIETVHVKYVDKILQTLQQVHKVCKDLRVDIPPFEYEGIPLGELHKSLLQRYAEYEMRAEARRKDLQELHKRMEEACESMGRVPKYLPESPLPTADALEELSKRVDQLESEKMDREEKFLLLKGEICDIVKELNVRPALDYEKMLLDLDDSTVLITDVDMEQLNSYHSRLVKQKATIKEEIESLRIKVDDLWNKLETDIAERNVFRQTYTGISIDTMDAFKLEVKRCEELKRANIKAFIDKQRQELAELWSKCHCSDDEKADFPFYDSDCYTEDLFELHEREIDKWKAHFDDNKDIYVTLENYTGLWGQRLELETNAQGPNRYKNRGGQLLAEEKMRNKLTKQIPRLEENLVRLAESFLIRTGRPFLTHGRTIQEYIANLHGEYEMELKVKLSAKKIQREQQQSSSIGRSKMNLFPTPSSTNMPMTPRNTNKRKVVATPASSSKKPKMVDQPSSASANKMPTVKLNTSKNRRLSRKKRRLIRNSLSKAQSNKENCNDTVSTSYNDFENDLTTRNLCRSTGFVLTDINNKLPPPLSPVKLTDLNKILSPQKVNSPLRQNRRVLN